MHKKNSSNSCVEILFNLVLRDKHQGEDVNLGTSGQDEELYYVYYLFGQINEIEIGNTLDQRQIRAITSLVKTSRNQNIVNTLKEILKRKVISNEDKDFIKNTFTELEPNKFAGYIEAGGQEYGAMLMKSRTSPADHLEKICVATSTNSIRSLSRSLYGNSVFPLHPNDLKKWYGYIKRHGNDPLFKLFDYNCNWREMHGALEVLRELDSKIEIAVPHSPEQSYQPFFIKKVKEAAELAQKYRATLSIKRMVTGLTTEDAINIANIIFPVAMQYGVYDVTLHAHGPVSDAVASFCARGKEIIEKEGCTHKTIIRIDVVPDRDNAAFPTPLLLVEALTKHGVDIDLSSRQEELLKEINQIDNHRDNMLKSVKVGAVWSNYDKIYLGMPDGGEAYSLEAIVKSGLLDELEISIDRLKVIFVIFYKEFRNRFGGVTSVTPGHKRIEIGSILSIKNMAKELKQLVGQELSKNKHINICKIEELIRNKTYNELYKNLPCEIVDAFRNNNLPTKLSSDALDFLCQANMAFVLKKIDFNIISSELKSELITNSKSKDSIIDIINNSDLPVDVIRLILTKYKEYGYNKMSLYDSAGIREYTEGDRSLEMADQFERELINARSLGVDIIDIKSSVAEAILAGGTDFVVVRANRGPAPTAFGVDKDKYDGRMSVYNKYLHAKRGTIITEYLASASSFSEGSSITSQYLLDNNYRIDNAQNRDEVYKARINIEKIKHSMLKH